MSFAPVAVARNRFLLTSLQLSHPYFFGPADARLFGWFHPPDASNGVRSCAVLLCQPVGHEYMYAYRAFRQLAERLAAQGFPVLRFDYLGTGDASGEPHGPHQVEAWQKSLLIALAELRERTNHVPVSLVGLRLGAMFAALAAGGAAAGKEPIDSVVLWDPCVAGKTYVRQVKMLAATSTELSSRSVVNEETGHLEALGYALTPEMVKSLQAIDLLQLHSPAFPRTLLVSRENHTPHDALARHLEQLGASVTQQAYTESEAFLVAAERSELPANALQIMVEWLARTYPLEYATSHDGAVSAGIPAGVDVGDTDSLQEIFPEGYVETPVFIDNQRLFGVVTTPPAIDTSKPAMVFLNMGTDHHVGPRRLYVHLARKVAMSYGLTSIRVDLSGIGDSVLPPDSRANNPYPDNAMDDIDAIIAYLQRTYGFEQVLLAGMCAGAYHSVYGSRNCEAVAGYIAINPPIYMKRGDPLNVNPFEAIDEANRLRQAVRSPSYWLKLLRGGVDARRVVDLAGRATGMVRNRVASVFRPATGNGAGADTVLSEMETLFSPDIDTHLIFDADDLGYRYLRHIAAGSLDRWKAHDKFTLSVVEGATHVFMPLAGQAVLNDLVLTWLSDRYAGETGRGRRRAVEREASLTATAS